MAEVERPTVITVLAVLALIGSGLSLIFGLIALIASFPVMTASFGVGLLLLVAAVFAIGSGVVGLLAGIKIFGNKPKGIYFLKLYAYIGVGYAVLSTIGAISQGGGFNIGSFIWQLLFPAVVLVVCFTQQPVKDYESQVG